MSPVLIYIINKKILTQTSSFSFVYEYIFYYNSITSQDSSSETLRSRTDSLLRTKISNEITEQTRNRLSGKDLLQRSPVHRIRASTKETTIESNTLNDAITRDSFSFNNGDAGDAADAVRRQSSVRRNVRQQMSEHEASLFAAFLETEKGKESITSKKGEPLLTTDYQNLLETSAMKEKRMRSIEKALDGSSTDSSPRSSSASPSSTYDITLGSRVKVSPKAWRPVFDKKMLTHGNDSTVFLTGVVVATHTDATYDIIIDRSSFKGTYQYSRSLDHFEASAISAGMVKRESTDTSTDTNPTLSSKNTKKFGTQISNEIPSSSYTSSQSSSTHSYHSRAPVPPTNRTTSSFQTELERRLDRVTRNCISLSAWSSMSGNVAPVLLSTLQPRTGAGGILQNNSKERKQIESLSSKMASHARHLSGHLNSSSLAQRLLNGPTDAIATKGKGGKGRPLSMRMNDVDISKMERKTTIALSEIPFFKFLSQTEAVHENITERHLNEIFKRFRFQIFPHNKTICYEGEIGKEFYIVLNGHVNVVRDGRKIATLKPGSWFGEIAVFKWTRRTATCIATSDSTAKKDGTTQYRTPTEVLSLSSKAFTELITEQPWLQLAMADLCHQRTGDMLSCISFFQKVPKAKLELLGSLFSYRSVLANTVICREGEDAHEFYILMQGQVKVKAISSETTSEGIVKGVKVLATVDSISWFGEIALIQDCQRTATVETSEDSTLLVLSKENFHRFLRVVPSLSETMREHMGERISHMIRAIPFFANVQKLELLSDLFSFREYNLNEIVFDQGDGGDAFYIIIRGSCEVRATKTTKKKIPKHKTRWNMVKNSIENTSNSSKSSSRSSSLSRRNSTARGGSRDRTTTLESKETILTLTDAELIEKYGKKLKILLANDFFGEIALLNDVPRTATIRCLEPTRLLQLPKHLFSKFVSFAPSIKQSLKRHLIETGKSESHFRAGLSEALLASATNSWIDADIDHLAGIDSENCPVPFDTAEVQQTPLAWGTGKAQLRANGDRVDGLPEDVIDPLQRGKDERQQYMVAEDQEIPKGFVLPKMFPIRILLPEQENDDLDYDSKDEDDQEEEDVVHEIFNERGK